MKIEIENYENMSVEEKLAALEAYEPDMSGYVAKSAFDKTASELAAAKKSLREKMTEDEAKAQKEAEERASLAARVKELEHERTVNGYMAEFTAMGYDAKLAKASAEALATGDTKTVFENQKFFTENREKNLKAEWIKGTPRPAGGNDPKIDYNKKITEAQASGDFTAAAYYTRLAAQEASANDE